MSKTEYCGPSCSCALLLIGSDHCPNGVPLAAEKTVTGRTPSEPVTQNIPSPVEVRGELITHTDLSDLELRVIGAHPGLAAPYGQANAGPPVGDSEMDRMHRAAPLPTYPYFPGDVPITQIKFPLKHPDTLRVDFHLKHRTTWYPGRGKEPGTGILCFDCQGARMEVTAPTWREAIDLAIAKEKK